LLPRLLLHLLGWILLCRVYQDALPDIWIWTAFPLALSAAYSAHRSNRDILPAALGIILFPWVLRILVFFVSLPGNSDIPVLFDNGWFLTAPYLYFSSLSLFMVKRRPELGVYEIIILTVFSVLLPGRDALWPGSFTGPMRDSMNLLLTVLILILTVVSLASVQKDKEIKLSGRKPVRRGTSPGGVLYGLLLALALIILLFSGNRVRREQSLQSGGGLLASDMFRFDFSDVLSLEPEISLNGEITMLYREDGPAVVRYLRRYTLSGWDDERGFFRDGEKESLLDGLELPVMLPKSPRSWDSGDYLARINQRQEYYLIALDPESFFSLNSPVSVEPWTIWDDASFTRAYAVESSVSIAGPWELADSDNSSVSGETLEYYLRAGDDPYFRDLAEEIAGEYNDPWTKASAIENWFHENYYYSLKPGLAPDGDQLGWFLRESRRGYCSYFAFAMTRICRAAGIPARVAVGFLTDPETSTLGFVPVRSDQAHAWVEVWFDRYGWIDFDPTSDVMAPGEEYPFQFISPDEWLPLIEEVLTRSGEVSVSIEEENESPAENPFWKRVLLLAQHRGGLLWITSGIIIFLVYLPRRIVPGLLRTAVLLSSRPGRRVQGSWRLFAGRLSRGGYPPFRDETPLEWAKRIDDTGIHGFMAWTELYLKAEYSPVFSPEDERNARDAEIRVSESWGDSGILRHLKAAVSPGWKVGFPW
jgi:transglutaminase-like putative cysteine protease